MNFFNILVVVVYGKQSLLGSCEPTCGTGNWTYQSARYTRAQLRLTRAEAVSRGWFCEEKMNGMTDAAGVNVFCRREDDLCLSCDEGCAMLTPDENKRFRISRVSMS